MAMFDVSLPLFPKVVFRRKASFTPCKSLHIQTIVKILFRYFLRSSIHKLEISKLRVVEKEHTKVTKSAHSVDIFVAEKLCCFSHRYRTHEFQKFRRRTSKTIPEQVSLVENKEEECSTFMV